MAIKSEEYSIEKLFCVPGVFVVPKFQREYAWRKKQLDQYTSDIWYCLKARLSGGKMDHFFGGVICAQIGTSTASIMNYRIIDGQQRLSSFVILAAALAKLMKRMSDDIVNGSASKEDRAAKKNLESAIKKIETTYLNYKHSKGRGDASVPKIELSASEKVFFQDVIEWKNPNAERESHKRILFARNWLVNFVESLIEDTKSVSDNASVLLLLYNEVLKHDCSVVFIWSDDRAEAYRVFQVLNDRGARLRDGDLLKAGTLEMLEDNKFKKQESELLDHWSEILQYPFRAIDNYLSWYYSSYHERRPNISAVTERFMKDRFKQGPLFGAESITHAQNIVSEANQLKDDFATLDKLANHKWPYSGGVGATNWDTTKLYLLVGYLKQNVCFAFASRVNIAESHTIF